MSVMSAWWSLQKKTSFELEEIPSVQLAIALKQLTLTQACRFHTRFRKHLADISVTV